MMTNIPQETDITAFEIYVSNLVETWLILMIKNQYKEAGELCVNFIDNYGSAFKKRVFQVNENEYNKLLILLVLVKGLHNYLQLCQVTRHRNWYEDNTTVEDIWIKLCDCRERLEFSSQFYQGEAIGRIIQDLDGLESFFRDTFGSGIYLSPGIVADKNSCSICQQDARACSHVAGRLYNGKICFYQPVNPQLNHVALVKIPKDRRCRIWSWHIKDNDEGEGIKIEKACVLTSFSVDDFLREIES